MSQTNEFSKTEARKFVYRQLTYLERKGWLSSAGSGREKCYTQTKTFKDMSFNPRAFQTGRRPDKLPGTASFSSLTKEKNEYEGELAIVLGEIDEYRSLLERFPDRESLFHPLFEEARERSARLLGRINALSAVLKAAGSSVTPC
ncbi:hypothetical protein [Vibrio mangrovi]